MQKIELLMTALEYMERHLRDEIKTEDVAAICFCSKSTLEKLFRKVFGISVHDYMIRRRMMLAAKKFLTLLLNMAIVPTNPLHVHLNRSGTANLLNFAKRNSQNYFRG